MIALLLALLFQALPARAELKILCVAEKTAVKLFEGRELEPDMGAVRREFVEKDLNLASAGGDVHRARLRFEFQLLPGLHVDLSIAEAMAGRRLRMSSQIAAYSGARRLARGADRLSFRAPGGKFRIGIRCDAYDKTLSLEPRPLPSDSRARLRELQINGGGSRRKYVNRGAQWENGDNAWLMRELEVYDLLQQLTRESGTMADVLRATVDEIEKQGFQLIVFSAWEGGRGYTGGNVALERRQGRSVERFNLLLNWGGFKVLGDANTDLMFGQLDIEGLIFRNSAGHIERYEITEVKIGPGEDSAGGGGSTSGGYITGGR